MKEVDNYDDDEDGQIELGVEGLESVLKEIVVHKIQVGRDVLLDVLELLDALRA